MFRISVLHATYKSPSSPLKHRDLWLSRAKNPERVEYIFAMNDDDVASITATAGALRVLTCATDDLSTAVQNWNSAAALSTGDVLFVISDDLFPPVTWDEQLDGIVHDCEPRARDFAIKVQDSPYPEDTTLRHPLISRRFYERFGLFDEAFRGVYCDNDITLRAFLFSVILDGRSVAFEHQHPHFDSKFGASASHAEINDIREYAWGKGVFLHKWSPLHKKLNLNRLTLRRRLTRHTPGSFLRRTLYRLLSSQLPRAQKVDSDSRSSSSL